MSDKTKLRAFIYDRQRNTLVVLDQTKLPVEMLYVPVKNTDDGAKVIRDMLVRGAPCIAAVACLSLIVELNQDCFKQNSQESLIDNITAMVDKLIHSRPTAVNLAFALNKITHQLHSLASLKSNVSSTIEALTDVCEDAINKGLESNERLGTFGAYEFLAIKRETSPLSILTHCNTGSLATVGHGTALGIIRTLHERNSLKMAYCTETRPYNQGSRLTAWELVQEEMPAKLIADSMVAFLMATSSIDAVVVGADRVAANGDTANKIGTLQMAVIAKHYQVPFYVAAPSQSIDLNTPNGRVIEIEQRPPGELRNFVCNDARVQLAPIEVDVWNPCFDITPAELISGIITEFGVCRVPGEIGTFLESEQVQQSRLALGEALF